MNTRFYSGQRVEALMACDDWQPGTVTDTQCPDGPGYARVNLDIAPEFEKFGRPTLCLLTNLRPLSEADECEPDRYLDFLRAKIGFAPSTGFEIADADGFEGEGAEGEAAGDRPPTKQK